MVASRIGTRLGLLGAVALLLTVAGCGCGDDTIPIFTPALPPPAQAQLGIDVPPLEVEAPEGPVRVDVMFLLDDSFLITERTGQTPLGRIEGDGRIKTDVAQEIFDDAADTLLQQLVGDGLGTAADFDLAFGVSRYEDYANFVRSGPASFDPSEVAQPIDSLARPFVLNLPILRRNHEDFEVNFAAALAREAPGDGGQNPFDAQSALEALWQLCSGDGFDGNGDGTLNESGIAGRVNTMLLQPPSNPVDDGVTFDADSGDVPSIGRSDWVDDGTDRDGEPTYRLGDVPASGTIGGAGWRPDSIRFIVLFSNITTVTVFAEDSYPVDAAGRISVPLTCNSDGPREEETVKSSLAFASTKGEDTLVSPPFSSSPPDQQAYARYGMEGTTPAIAPPGAARLFETIDILNELNVEVLSIGFREASVGPGPNKPNQPGPAIGNNESAVPDPQVPPLDNKAPFTWMSAVAILTGALDTETSTPIPGRDGERGLPLVYNLTTVNPLNLPITDDVVEDLSDRVGEWLPYVPGGSGGGGDPGYVYWRIQLDTVVGSPDLTLFSATPLVPDTDPDGLYVSQSGAEQVVRVPCYYVGTARPDPVRVAWLTDVRRTDVEGTNDVDGPYTFSLDAALLPPAEIPAATNPTGPVPTTMPVPEPEAGTGSVYVTIAGAQTTPPPSTSTLVEVLSGNVYFRDVTRGIPAGAGIDSMAGPFPPEAVPYPAP